MRQFKTSGYWRVALYDGVKCKKYLVHRLVAYHFKRNPLRLKEVNHKNGNKECNESWNLEWISTKDNHLHAAKNKLKASGNRHGMVKITEKQVKEIKKKYIPWEYSAEKIGKEYRVTKQCILYILKNR